MGLQYVDIPCPDELGDGAFRIIQVTRDPCLGGAVVHTGRVQSFLDPVKAEGAFVYNVLVGMEIPATIRARLNAILASDAVFFVDQYNPLLCFKGGSDRTNLHAGRFGTMVAHLGHEEGFLDIVGCNGLGKSVNSAVRRNNLDGSVLQNGILFDPTPEKEGFPGYIIFNFAGFGTGPASDAFFDVDGDAIPGAFCIPFDCRIQYGIKSWQGRGCNQCSGCDPGILEEIAAG